MRNRVFISYTSELDKYPNDPLQPTFLKAAIDAVSASGCIPHLMKDFVAVESQPADHCRRAVEACDAFVGIIGFRWGSAVPGVSEKSYVDLEHEAAEGKPRYVFLLDDAARTAFPADVLPDASHADGQRQQTFRARMERHRTGSRIATPAALRAAIEHVLRGLPAPEATIPLVTRDVPPEIKERIGEYQSYLDGGDYDSAFNCFFMQPTADKSLNYRLDFEFNQCSRHFELVHRFFRGKATNNPPVGLPWQQAVALNSLARALKNTGRLTDSIKTFERQIRALGNVSVDARTLTNYVNVLRLAGKLRDASLQGHKLLALADDPQSDGYGDPRSEGYSLYWNGIVAAACGADPPAEELLHQAEVKFEKIQVDDWCRGLGRTYAHLAQLELVLGSAELGWRLANHSRALAGMHRECRELIFTSRLMGGAESRLGRFDDAHLHLKAALDAAESTGYVEEKLAIKIGLAELELVRPQGNLTLAQQRLTDVQREAGQHGYRLLETDALLRLADVFQRLGNRDAALVMAKKAHDRGMCGDEEFPYLHGVEEARRQLSALDGASLPRPPSAGGATGLWRTRDQDENRDPQGEPRREFFRYLRTMSGPYRYAPTKFRNLLCQHWDRVCDVIHDHDSRLPPQHVELHLGDPCNLRCVFCRGGPRRERAKTRGKNLAAADAVGFLRVIHNSNPTVFVRFSGLIGEPLIHPGAFEVLTAANDLGMAWGITTNGIRLSGTIVNVLMGARYVHVSLDAGSHETYERLKPAARKKGAARHFDLVLSNLKEFVQERSRRGGGPQVVASFLLQPENFHELFDVARTLKHDVRIDSLEIKMQHYHEHARLMKHADVDQAYAAICSVRGLDDGRFRVVVVQSCKEAHGKVDHGGQGNPFSRCYAGALGLTATVDPAGTLQACCQYYQETLGAQGTAVGARDFIADTWHGEKRRESLRGVPQRKCGSCSPSDQFVNECLSFLHEHAHDEGFLQWVERQIKIVLRD